MCSSTPRVLALPSAQLISESLGGGEGKQQDSYPDKVRALPGPSLWAGCPEPVFCQLGGWEEGLRAGVGWESQPWESTAGNKVMRRERASPFRSLNSSPESHPSSRRAAGARAGGGGVLGFCSRKAGARRVEGVAVWGCLPPEGGPQGGLRRCEASAPRPGYWVMSAVSYVPFPRTWGVIASVSWTRTLRSMRDEVPTGRSKGGLDAQAQADLSYHLPSWTIVDKCVRHL